MSYYELFIHSFNVQIILVLFAILLLSSYAFSRRNNLPPGPWRLPLLGNLPTLALNLYRTGKEPEQLFADIAKKYGEVFSLKFGTKLVVIVNGFESIKDISKDPRVNDRPRSTLMEEIELDVATLFSSGKSWKFQRTFMLKTFRAFGVGRIKFEGNVIKEAATLVNAGTESPTSTLRWALLYMMKYPEIQAKVHQEIDAVVGPTRMPQWADRSLLPYTEAVLLEIQRIRTNLATSFPRVASEDTKLAGYDIPKGTFVIFNHWAVHNDPDVWAEPEQFKPERFVDDDGKLLHREELMPFSKGHRQCLGENLAKMEFFLFFTYILHSFTITKPSDAKAPSMKGISGVSLSPTPFQIVLTERKKN
ncbi:cytochrome P450 2U1-like [Amphiura filiformis]|uniref:cytochrome P450 2U1-like n=1 Tax=Amphiura filiformis TaxID=82378 RepID=UPI003B2156D8